MSSTTHQGIIATCYDVFKANKERNIANEWPIIEMLTGMKVNKIQIFQV